MIAPRPWARALAALALCVAVAACGSDSKSAGGCDPKAPVDLKHIAIPSIQGKTASFDALEIDQQAHLLYAADRTDSGIDVIDISKPTGRHVVTIPLPSAPNGLTLAKEFGRLYVGLNDSSVAVIQLDPAGAAGDKVVATIKTGGKARVDLLDYDGKEKKVYAANPDDGFVTSIDAAANKPLKKINVAPGLEQPRYDSVDGKVYVPASAADVIYRIDPVRDEVTQKASVGTKCGPAGLAINPTTGLALLGCQNVSSQQVVVWNLQTGKLVNTLADAGGADLVLYDQLSNRFYVAAPNNSGGAEIAIFSGSPVAYFTSVKTKALGGSVAYDHYNQVVYTSDQRPNKGELLSFRVPAC